MKMRRSYFLFSLIYLLIFSQCGTKRSESASEETQTESATTGFVANPQVIEEQDVNLLATNAVAPDFNLPATDGKFYSLKDFADADVLVIIFTCNHCPTAQAYEDRMIQLVKDYEAQNVRFVAISPNSVKGLLLEEMGYSDMGDTYEEMKMRVKDKGYNFVYLYDGDTQEASIKYGPVATPHAYVFDKERKLKYNGRLDATEKPGTANSEDVREAIDAVLAGTNAPNPVTKTFGCSIKWGWKLSWTKKVNEDWKNEPVELVEIDTEGVELLMNNDTDKLSLINLWATWCGPCVIEYPEFVDIHRMYKERDFEFISLSADKIAQKEKALKFLKKKHSAVRNYIYSGKDIYELITAIDPNWDGALPYTVLLEPGGKIVYKEMGTIEPYELKKIIVDHPMIGRYY